MAEIVWATLKNELIYRRSWPTRAAAGTTIFDYIGVSYNRTRRHSALDFVTPTDYEYRHTHQRAA